MPKRPTHIDPKSAKLSQAPLQKDLEEAIAEAGGADQRRLLSSDAARRRFKELAKAQISAYAQKEREKAKRKPPLDNSPTPERLAKLTDKEDVREHAVPVKDKDTRALQKAHTIVAPLDRYGGFLPRDLVQAARDLRDIFLIAETGYQRVTGSYDGVPSGAFGSKAGGVQDHIRECQSMATLIKSDFPDCIKDINHYLTQIVVKPDGSAIRFEDGADAVYCPWIEPGARKAAGWGGFIRSLQILTRFLYKQRAMGWGRRSVAPEITRALNVELRARAQIMREQEERRRIEEEKRQRAIKGGK